MNYLAILRQCVAYVCFFLAVGFVLSLTAFVLRKQLRVLLDRWRALGRLGQCVTLVFVTGFVLYGGSKNMPSSPPSDDDEDSDSHLEPLLSPESVAQLSRMMESGSSPSLQLATANPSDGDELPLLTRQAVASTESDSLLSTFNSQLSTIQRWHARGAWEDWRRIEFPGGFAFPIGTNQITEVVLMSQGALRTIVVDSDLDSTRGPDRSATGQVSSMSRRGANVTPGESTSQLSTFNIQLPYRVSLEPGVSTVSYGLTASNSFLVAWENACVERSATNRVNASIELFRNGDTLVTVQPTTGNQQPTTIFTPASLPEGWVGEGQNAAWATNAFPEFAENIATNGYENWLADYVGINEQNGRYKAIITICELPEDGPCYLECGPYKVVVKETGTYSFPLEVCQHYRTRTYPVAVPLSIDYDDGYRGNAELPSASSTGQASLQSSWVDYIYDTWMAPEFRIWPTAVDLDNAVGTCISIWCNSSNSTQKTYHSLSGLTSLVFCAPSQAEITQAAIEDLVVFRLEQDGIEVSGSFHIVLPSPDHPHCHQCYNPHCPCEGWCLEDCGCHASGTNGVYCIGDPDWTFPDF